jgi:hypothetical protein
VPGALLASLWLRFHLLGHFSIEITLNCCEDIQASPAPVSNNHLPLIIGLELISIFGLVPSLDTTALISSTSLQANLMQVCGIKLMIDGSAKISSDGSMYLVWLFDLGSLSV